MNIRLAVAADRPAIAVLQAESWRDSDGDVMPVIRFDERPGGIRGEQTFENFCYDVSSIQINWPDTSTICKQTEGIDHA